ncbi:MAG: hypothetical protein ACK50P_22560, partial [Planctomycetaceae bacterium]
FEDRIEQRLTAMAERCVKQKRAVGVVERDVGRLLAQNTRAARLFEVRVAKRQDGYARLEWKKQSAAQDWSDLGDEGHPLSDISRSLVGIHSNQRP